MKYCILDNPKSGNHQAVKSKIQHFLTAKDSCYYISMPSIKDFRQFFKDNTADIVVCGGDGTLSYFLNKITKIKYPNHIWYLPTGSGNDFHADLQTLTHNLPSDKPYRIDQFIQNLPLLKVKNQLYRVFNGAGAGMDGDTCATGETLRKKGKKNINYTLIGLKNLLYKYSPQNITIKVDNQTHHFSHVWLSPVMLGKFFGGGMMIAPNQNRQKPQLSTIVVTCKNRLKLISLFPKIFHGTHIKHSKNVKILQGNHFHITLSRPAPLQYDGEVIPHVSEYEVWLNP